MSNMDFIKKLLKGSTTMPQGTPMGGGGAVHYHDGVACTHDHSHDHDHTHDHSHDHGHHHHHEDGSCCDHDHSKDKK